MKVLIISPSQGHYGGMEGFVIGLASTILAWPEIEVRVCFKLVGKFQLEKDLKNIAAALPCPVHFVRSGEWKLLQLIRWADIVHGQNTSPDIIFPGRLTGKKVVLTIHNWRRRDLGLHSILWGMGVKFAHRRWYISKFVWDTWEPDDRSIGSDCVPSVHHLSGLWFPPPERKGFLFLGRWIKNKGIEDLVTAYSRAKLDPAKWPLTLLGHGPLKAEVEALVRNLGVSGVVMPGFLEESEKGRRLASARWLVAPSNTREDLGVTPIEARSAGVPVIVTRDGGLPEAGGDAALIVEPGNIDELSAALKTAAAMSDEEYCERGERGRRTLNEYLRPAEFYRESYAALMNGKGG